MNTATRLSTRISPLNRIVVLESGEANFDVHHESLRAFNVQAGKLNIRDIGTRFSVRLHDVAVPVAILQGAVEINDERLDEGYQRMYQSGISRIGCFANIVSD